MAISIDACVAQHQGDRKEQQDRVAILPHPRLRGTVLAVVADGMGGHSGGALAAEQVVHTAKTNLDHFAGGDETPRSMLESTLLEAHSMIKTSRVINEKDPHSTAVVMLLHPEGIDWAHCGDSRLYRFHEGVPVSRTVDHSYVEHLIETGRITPEAALTHPNRNVLVTSLGGKEDPKFSFAGSSELCAGDSFVLCSDGVWAYFEDDELGRIVAGNSARHACEQLIDLARVRACNQGDNLSLAVIKLVEIVPAKPALAAGRFK